MFDYFICFFWMVFRSFWGFFGFCWDVIIGKICFEKRENVKFYNIVIFE